MRASVLWMVEQKNLAWGSPGLLSVSGSLLVEPWQSTQL